MTREMTNLIETVLTQLAVRAPLLAGIGRGCHWEEWTRPGLSLGATDGMTICLHRDLLPMSDEIKVLVIAHEITHVAHRHPQRSGWVRLDNGQVSVEGRDKMLWNVAIDDATNSYLVACGVVTEQTVHDLKAVLLRRFDLGVTPEERYYELESDRHQQPPPPPPPPPDDDDEDEDGDAGAGEGEDDDGGSGGDQSDDDDEDNEDDADDDDDEGDDSDDDGDEDDEGDGEGSEDDGDDADEEGDEDDEADGDGFGGSQSDGEGKSLADKLADLAEQMGSQAGGMGPVLPPTQEIIDRQDERMADVQALEEVLSQGAGGEALGLNRGIVERGYSEINWRTILIRYCDERAGRRDYTYRRMDTRRSLGRYDVVMPAMQGGDPSRILIAVDASGSITQQQLGAMIADVQACLSQVPGTDVQVMTWDHAAYGPWPIRDLPETLPGGGTTKPETVWPEAQQGNYRCVVMLTDGIFDGSTYAQLAYPIDPGVDVLWLLYAPNSKFKPPFGEVAPMFDQWRARQ